jgi:hypothetical protein
MPGIGTLPPTSVFKVACHVKIVYIKPHKKKLGFIYLIDHEGHKEKDS